MTLRLTKNTAAASLALAALVTVLYALACLNWDPAAAAIGLWKKTFDLVTGFWLMIAMVLACLTSLRLAAVDRFLGGLPQSYRLHRWLGIACAVFLALHWLSAKSLKWAVQWGILPAGGGRPARAANPDIWTQLYGFWGHNVAWLGWTMAALLVLALFAGFLRQGRWVWVHRLLMPVTILSALHGVCAFSGAMQWGWAQAFAAVLLVASVWIAVLEFRIGARGRLSGAVVVAQKSLSDTVKSITIEVDGKVTCRPGQFAFVGFTAQQHPHPLSIVASKIKESTTEIEFYVKALGTDTRCAVSESLLGRKVRVQGPFGEFLQNPNPQFAQLWVAGGIGVTPFLSVIKAGSALPGTHLVWCSRGCGDALENEVRTAAAQAGVELAVLDSSAGQRLGSTVHLRDVMPNAWAAQTWCCGPRGLSRTLAGELNAMGGRSAHCEHFAWR